MAQTAPVLDLEWSDRREFLRGLESKTGRHRYSRYNGLPLRYAGGKSRAVGFIMEHNFLRPSPRNFDSRRSAMFAAGPVPIASATTIEAAPRIQARRVSVVISVSVSVAEPASACGRRVSACGGSRNGPYEDGSKKFRGESLHCAWAVLFRRRSPKARVIRQGWINRGNDGDERCVMH